MTSKNVYKFAANDNGNMYALTSKGVFRSGSATGGWAKIGDGFEGDFSSVSDMKAVSTTSARSIAGNVQQSASEMIVMTAGDGAYYSGPVTETSVNDYVNSDDIAVYPNPVSTTGTLELDMNNEVFHSITVYNSSGEKVIGEKTEIIRGDASLDLGNYNLAPGAYYLILKDNRRQVVKKFVIVK